MTFYLRSISTFIFLIVSTFINADQIENSSPTNSTTNVGDIYLSVTNVPTNTTGFIVSIYRKKDSFLKEADEVYFFSINDIKNNELVLKGINYGSFAIAITADQNGNQILDTKIFGIPNEPVGFANNPKGRFGPPRFKDSVITHSSPQQKFVVELVSI